MTARLATIFCYRKDLQNILWNIKHSFWKLQDYDEVSREEIIGLMKLGAITAKILILCYFITGMAFSMFTIIFGQLSLEIYVPDKYGFNFQSLSLMEILYSWFAIFATCGFDVTFLAICLHVIVQLKLLKLSLKDISFNEGEENVFHSQLKKFIEQKIVLNKTIEMMRSSFAGILLVMFCVTAPVVCAEIHLALHR